MNCPICNNPEPLRGADYQWCPECHTVRTDYAYDPSIYDAAYAYRYFQYRSSATAEELAAYRLGMAEKWAGNGRLLDVGCGTGEFLHHASGIFECYGTEVNQAARLLCYKHLQPHLLSVTMNGQRGFGMITLFDVFEHFEDPQSTFLDLKKRLAPGGAILMVTPNVDAVPFGDHAALAKWKHFKVREHLFLYTLDSFIHLAEKHGMKVVHYDFGESKIRAANPNNDILSVVLR